MATNQTGIALTIKAWLPITGSISEQIATLQTVEAAHTSGDYTALLNTAKVEDVKAEQKTRRVEDQPAAVETQPEPEVVAETPPVETVEPVAEEPAPEPDTRKRRLEPAE